MNNQNKRERLSHKAVQYCEMEMRMKRKEGERKETLSEGEGSGVS